MAWREGISIVLLCFAWYGASAGSGVVGKIVLGSLPWPVTLAMVQLISLVILSAPALAVGGVRPTPSFPRHYYSKVLLPLAIAKFLTTVCSLVSIWRVPVSYAHTVKATTPLWTALLARIIFGERVSRGVFCALILIALGVCVASVTELQWESGGLIAALSSAALLSLQHLYSKRVLKESGIHHLRLMALLSKLALLMLTPMWVWFEGSQVWAALWSGEITSQSGLLLIADGCLAWLQAVFAFTVLSKVSPLTYAVASAAKRAVVVLISLLLLQNPTSLANLAGMSLALFGVLVYNRARLFAKQDNYVAKPLLPI